MLAGLFLNFCLICYVKCNSMKMVFSLSTHTVVPNGSYTDHELKEHSRSLKCSTIDWSMKKLNCSIYIRHVSLAK